MDDYFDELIKTMSTPRVEARASVGKAVRIALILAYMGRDPRPRKRFWQDIPDQEDWWVLDLAFESGADHIITWNMGHLAPARDLGFDVLALPAFLALLPSSPASCAPPPTSYTCWLEARAMVSTVRSTLVGSGGTRGCSNLQSDSGLPQP